MTNLAGLHDRESTELGITGTWVLDTISLSENPSPPTYDPAYSWIGRLNWGYGSTGTLPVPANYGEYARRAAAYVAASKNCRVWVVGNEPSLRREWPDGQPIFPWQYADAYKLTRKAIHALAGHGHDEVLIAASGPWNNELKYSGNPTGDWIKYFSDAIQACGSEIDGFSIHSYCHSYNVALVTSSARMDAPFQNRRFEFRTYRDYCEAIPASLRHLPCYLTEANGDGPWQAVGLIPAMLNEIDAWNQIGKPQFRAVIFYRYPKFDQYYIKGRQDVIAEYRAAVGKGYPSPVMGQNTVSDTTFLPSTPNQSTSTPAPTLPRQWDERLTQRGVTIETPPLVPGQRYWRVAKARWYNEQESQGRHHIYVEAVDEQGAPVEMDFAVFWPSGIEYERTNGKSGFDAANFPMSASRNEFGVGIDTSAPSEKLTGIGMGADTPGGFNAGIHTSTGVVFQLATAPQTQQPPVVGDGPTVPQPVDAYVVAPAGANVRTSPELLAGNVITAVPYGEAVRVIAYDGANWAEVLYNGVHGYIRADLLGGKPVDTQPTPQPTGDNWSRAWPIVLKIEGGLSLDPNDTGNWYQGKLIGTKFGISAAVWGGQYDIPNLTKEQALDIYKRAYWDASGANDLPWPMCLIVFDTAVNHGVGVAKALLNHKPTREETYLGLRALRYFEDPKWRNFGIAWGNRIEHLDDIVDGEIAA